VQASIGLLTSFIATGKDFSSAISVNEGIESGGFYEQQ
jgi:hypothetical protein